MAEPRFDPPQNSLDPHGCRPGAVFLKEAILAHWPNGTAFGGCYLFHGKTDKGTPSFHGVGRAVDIMVRSDHIATGDAIFQYLYDHRNQVGLNEVIYNGKIWYGGTPNAGIHPYAVNPHRDHVHMAINEDGASKLLAWYQQPNPITGEPSKPSPLVPVNQQEQGMQTVYYPVQDQLHSFWITPLGDLGHAWVDRKTQGLCGRENLSKKLGIGEHLKATSGISAFVSPIDLSLEVHTVAADGALIVWRWPPNNVGWQVPFQRVPV